jgi:hypothetical protein
MSGQSLCKPA